MDRPGWNASRRNRNIGTSHSGHGQDNRLVIPEQWSNDRFFIFYEKLRNPIAVRHLVGEREIVILVEPVIKGYRHCCTPDDVFAMLHMVPPADFEEIRVIVLRQPKRKEVIMSSVWGRMAYFTNLGALSGPVVYLESQEVDRTLREPKSMSVEYRREFERLRADGHPTEELTNSYVRSFTQEACRNTQLYRTLLHEIGHHEHYVTSVDRPRATLDNDDPEWDAIGSRYLALSHTAKEDYAHRYADRIGRQLRQEGRIPFDRMWDADRLRSQGLDPAWFEVPQ